MPERSPPDDPFDLDQPDPGLVDELGGPPGEPRGLIPEVVKKAVLAGVGALFMTEEGARRLAREWKLPKELVGYIGGQAQAAKEELLRVMGAEVRRFLQSDAIRREFLKALADNTIEIHAEIRVKPAADGVPPRPEVKATGGVRRGRTRPATKKAR